MIFVEWDPEKAQKNWNKHGVPFDEAATVAFDVYALWIPDKAHSKVELRMIIIGRSEAERILTVVFTFRSSENHEKEIYRIISARPASKAERKTYFQETSIKG